MLTVSWGCVNWLRWGLGDGGGGWWPGCTWWLWPGCGFCGCDAVRWWWWWGPPQCGSRQCMGPKAPTATPTAPSFETPYLETILPDGAARSLLATAFPSRERLCSSRTSSSPPHSRLTLATSRLRSSPPLRSFGRWLETTRRRRRGSTRCVYVTVNAVIKRIREHRRDPSSRLLSMLGRRENCRLSWKRWRGDDPSSSSSWRASESRRCRSHVTTVRFLAQTRVHTSRARPVNSSIVDNGAPWWPRARLFLHSVDSPKSPPSPVDDGPRRASPHERHQASPGLSSETRIIPNAHVVVGFSESHVRESVDHTHLARSPTRWPR